MRCDGWETFKPCTFGDPSHARPVVCMRKRKVNKSRTDYSILSRHPPTSTQACHLQQASTASSSFDVLGKSARTAAWPTSRCSSLALFS